jgi:hypothetical protein
MGQTAPPHSQLLTRAARGILLPMGLTQKGRSRVWLDDHDWWVCVVEFQPSSWSRGSYLNVGCMWLWHVKDFVSFDEGSRVESFSQFEEEAQFQLEAERLATKAADEVSRYRELFPDIKAVADFYIRKPPVIFWPSFHAAVACAAAGQVKEAERFFKNVTDFDDKRDWVVAAQAEAVALMSIASRPDEFRAVLVERVQRTRALQRLAPAGSIDFGVFH